MPKAPTRRRDSRVWRFLLLVALGGCVGGVVFLIVHAAVLRPPRLVPAQTETLLFIRSTPDALAFANGPMEGATIAEGIPLSLSFLIKEGSGAIALQGNEVIGSWSAHDDTWTIPDGSSTELARRPGLPFISFLQRLLPFEGLLVSLSDDKARTLPLYLDADGVRAPGFAELLPSKPADREALAHVSLPSSLLSFLDGDIPLTTPGIAALFRALPEADDRLFTLARRDDGTLGFRGEFQGISAALSDDELKALAFEGAHLAHLSVNDDGEVRAEGAAEVVTMPTASGTIYEANDPRGGRLAQVVVTPLSLLVSTLSDADSEATEFSTACLEKAQWYVKPRALSDLLPSAPLYTSRTLTQTFLQAEVIGGNRFVTHVCWE